MVERGNPGIENGDGGMTGPVWVPSHERIAQANMSAFLRYAGGFQSYSDLYHWSVMHPEEFWPVMWKFAGLIADGSEDSATSGSAASDAPGVSGEGEAFEGDKGKAWEAVVRGIDRMAPPEDDLGPRWFIGARLNFAENLLRYRDNRDAIVAWSESGRQRSLSYAELYREVCRVAAALREHGVRQGDRVAGFMPNIPEAIVAMLATASIGAVWSSCSPEFGVQGVLDRFGQIEPRVLFCADSYVYAGRQIDCLAKASEVVRRIDSIERVVVIPYRDSQPDLSGLRVSVLWNEFAASAWGSVEFERLPFDHPLYILYSSGTTGLPKCMVHGAGGTLLQHYKELLLHTDLKRDDRVFYFTTLGWMMWNWLVSALAVGSTVVLYDGAPFPEETDILWRMAAAEQITVFGTSAKYLAMCEKTGLAPRSAHDLSALRTILSTGSPLALHSFDYVYSAIKRDVHLASISGGTDIVSCFAGGNPIAPVYRGELQCRALGMAVHVFNANGEPVVEEAGELVCTRPFVSMPVAFWNDPDRSRYREAYFDKYPNVWRHGDWAELTEHEGMIIYGRSDATLNPAGVRIGTAEIYRQVEQMPEIVESVAVGQEIGEGASGDVRIVLFVRLREGLHLDDALREKIRKQIRDNTSPLHVPKIIIEIQDIPRTISGKLSELAVRDVLHGRAVSNTEALANPEALDLYRNIEQLRA
ncbi:MAG TPA: acetoacetate--CoA ligase [Gemmatimonadaceae bacterium]|nr:acetoacetate--CoA ligase [Gemmatimonadaceae bacterium]